MKHRATVASITAGAIAIALMTFLFAPVMYWGTFPGDQLGLGYCVGKGCLIGCCFHTQSYPVYRSLGCELLEFGIMFSPAWGNGIRGLRSGCSLGIIMPPQLQSR